MSGAQLRIAMRRTRLCIELLPKKIRKAKATRTFLTSLDESSKANARVRDLDIILSKISTYKQDPSNGRADLRNQGDA